MWQRKYRKLIAISAIVLALQTANINADVNYTVLSDSGTIRSKAKAICEENNGTLPSFVNQADIDKMFEATGKSGQGYWTGLMYRSSSGVWSFDDNADTTFVKTEVSLPSDANGGGCVKMEGNPPTFTVVHCTESRYVLCQTGQRSPPLLSSVLSYSPSQLPKQTSDYDKVFFAAPRSSSQLPKQTSQHDTETSSLSHLPTSTTSHGKATSSLSHLPTSTTSHGKATSSLSNLPTSTTSHGKETSSLSHLPTSTTSHGKETSSLNHLPTSTISHGKASAASSSQAACVGMSTTRVENHKLEGSVFSQFRVKNIAQCGMKCFDEKECRSFNFIPSSLSCELNNSTGRLGSKNLKPAPGVTYFYRNGRMLQAS